MKTARPPVGYIVVNTLMLWVATAVASVALWPIYQSMGIVIVVAAATVIGSLIAILGAIFRWVAPIVLAATVVAFFAFGVPLAVPAKTMDGVLPTVGGLLDLTTGVALGWKQLLTITLPVGQYEALLVPFWALILVLTVVSLSIALRAKHGDLGAIGPVILLVTAIAFGSTVAIYPVEISLGLLIVVLVWIIWRRVYQRRASIRLLAGQSARSGATAPVDLGADTRFVGFRTIISAGLILVLAAGTAVAAAAVLPPKGSRDVLRSATTQPFEPRDYVSPLSGFRSYWEVPKTDDVMMTVRGLPKGALIRIATLDTYDGVVYSVGSAAVNSASGSFTRVPYVYNQNGVSGKQVDLQVDIQDYTGVWLPTVGKFEKVGFTGKNATALRDDFFYNDTSGTAADVAHLEPGDSYTLEAVIPKQPSMSALSKLDPGNATVPAIGVLPAQLNTVLNGYVAGASSQGDKLVAMIDALKKNGYVSHGVGTEPASRSGHAADRINELLTDPLMIGDAEQYSVTAALMATELGFPSRVVMGFVPTTTGPGTSEIKGDDVSAWIEVDTAQYGWVTINPNPPDRAIPVIPPKDPDHVARPQTIVPPPTVQDTPPDPDPSPDTKQHAPAVPNAFLLALFAVLTITGWVLLGILVVLSPFIVILVAKARRRRKRRKGATPLDRITGGWQEFEDSVVDNGFDPPPAATRSEVATTVGGTQPAILAAVADRATFAPGAPDQQEGDLVWRSVRELIASLGADKTRWERLKARLSLRSLGGYSRSTNLNRSLKGRTNP